jgi:hypothetical protein
LDREGERGIERGQRGGERDRDWIERVREG